MYQEFDSTNQVQINRDDKGVARELLHTDEHVTSQARTAQLAAADYLDRYGHLLGLQSGETDNLSLAPQNDAGDWGAELRFKTEKQNFDMTTVLYEQTRFGLPVWHGGVAVHMKGKPYRIVSSQSTRHPDLDVRKPQASTLERAKHLDAMTLARVLGLSGRSDEFDAATLAVERVKLIIYRYEAAKRARFEAQTPDASGLRHGQPTLPLPPVARNIEESQHYVSAEVHFALAPRGAQILNWVAIIEAETLTVLYLRAFVDNTQGQVFLDDPMTTNGGPLPNATTANLNSVSSSVLLQGLSPGSPQPLIGSIVRVVDVELPTIAAPTEPSGTDFNFNARTNEFAAVNAYYHCDRFFRLMQDLGFTLSSFFGTGTAFPSAVDHRGHMGVVSGVEINAHCLGTGGGLGILQTTFALADLTDTANPLGIACDYRVVLHELGGHGVLYPHVHSPNFGFSHSAGDSVAAITCDPDTHAPDRFVTFPWVNIGRRHDRTPAAGWGWSGSIALNPFSSFDPGGYNNEQILCSTLFQFYRSIGGDAASLAMRQYASRYAVYLILRAISSLTPSTNPSNAAGFATAMMTADLGDWTTAGEAGGAYGKVIRWAFEKQGLYQPAGTPTPNNNIGAPPAIDVYIDDGRQGEYQYQPNWWSNQNIWNRLSPDGGTTHQEPVVGVTNYAYVRIKNRGTQIATGVTVKAFHAFPSAGLVYPNDWHAMTTAQLAAANVAPNNSVPVVVGPFQWLPSSVGHECVFMIVSATGDPSNISNMTVGDAIGEWRLVPNDNNVGQRNMYPVVAIDDGHLIKSWEEGMQIQIKNPLHSPAKMTVETSLPSVLSARGWSVVFDNPGAGAFALKPGESKLVLAKLMAGKAFTAEDINRSKQRKIDIVVSANGIVVGGMTYPLTTTTTKGRAAKSALQNKPRKATTKTPKR